MSTNFYWYSIAPGRHGLLVCQSLDYWEFPLRTVIDHCRKHLDERVIINEYGEVWTGQKFLERLRVEEGDGKGVRLCDEDDCHEPATLPPSSRFTYPRWCAAHAEDVA